MFKWQQYQHRRQLIPGRALVTAAALTALVLSTGAGPAAARQDPGPIAGRTSAMELLATAVPSSDGGGGLATDLAYQAFRSGERAAFGQVGESADEAFRSGERAALRQNAGAETGAAGQDVGPVTARVGHEAECFLQRVDTQYVRCDNNTGNGVPAPAWIHQR
jgi:hypothetical protein